MSLQNPILGSDVLLERTHMQTPALGATRDHISAEYLRPLLLFSLDHELIGYNPDLKQRHRMCRPVCVDHRVSP